MGVERCKSLAQSDSGNNRVRRIVTNLAKINPEKGTTAYKIAALYQSAMSTRSPRTASMWQSAISTPSSQRLESPMATICSVPNRSALSSGNFGRHNLDTHKNTRSSAAGCFCLARLVSEEPIKRAFARFPFGGGAVRFCEGRARLIRLPGSGHRGLLTSLC